MSAIGRKKEVRYLLRRAGDSPEETVRKKERLTEQGYLVVTMIEGEKNGKRGLEEVIKNHVRGSCGGSGRQDAEEGRTSR